MSLLPRRLNVRIILIVSCILLATGVISGWITARNQADRLLTAMRTDAVIIVRHFAESYAHHLLVQDYAGLEEALIQSAELPEIRSLQICEPDGTLILDVNRSHGGQPHANTATARLVPPSSRSASIAVENDRLVIWQPVMAGSLLGWLKVDYNLAGIRQTQTEIWKSTIVMSLAWVVCSAILIILLLRPIVQSINRLTAFAMQLDEHKGAQTAVPDQPLEIAELGASLNEASRKLLVTERQILDERERLQKSEENYRRLLDTVQEGIWVFDEDAITSFVNPRMAEILGYSPEEMIGKQLYSFIDGSNKQRANCIIKYREQGIDEQHDFEFLRKNGERIYARLETGPIFNAAGQYAGSIAAVADVTERKKAEEELLKLTSAIEQSPITIVITDAEGNIEFVNPKFTEVTGYLPEEVIGKNPRIMKSDEAPADEYQQLWDTITSGNVWHGEFYNKKKNGEFFRENATIAPVRNREGMITHYIALKEDITERRKLEDQLRHAQKMETIGQIAGGVAHDFNNLLQVITTCGFMTQLQLKEHGLPPTYVDELMAASRRAVELTSALLAFSRKKPLNLKPVELNRVLMDSRNLLKRVIGEDIVFAVTPAPCEISVRADDGALHQILMNLATNARDAMPRGGKLTIAIEKVRPDDAFRVRNGCEGSGELALISVTDTGDGIAPEDLQRIFEPFFTTKGPGKGTGLGLAITYNITHQHNGFIEVDSVKGEGTSFRIYLPILLDRSSAKQREAEIEISHGSGTVLLVEDEQMVRRSLQSVISSCGYSVLEAADGEEAVKLFRETVATVDLVILDVIMPGHNGVKILEEIRAIKPGIKSIFLSGYTADILKSKGMEGGGDLLIMKPVYPPLLLKAIRELLNPDHPVNSEQEAVGLISSPAALP